jgi:hypothetical protein
MHLSLPTLSEEGKIVSNIMDVKNHASTKKVCDPKAHAENEKNETKKATENPKRAAPTKSKKAAKKPRADEPLHAKDEGVDTEEPVTEFRTKVNKYAFLHVPKRAIPSLPFKLEKPLVARIDGENLVIVVATENQTK